MSNIKDAPWIGDDSYNKDRVLSSKPDPEDYNDDCLDEQLPELPPGMSTILSNTVIVLERCKRYLGRRYDLYKSQHLADLYNSVEYQIRFYNEKFGIERLSKPNLLVFRPFVDGDAQ